MPAGDRPAAGSTASPVQLLHRTSSQVLCELTPPPSPPRHPGSEPPPRDAAAAAAAWSTAPRCGRFGAGIVGSGLVDRGSASLLRGSRQEGGLHSATTTTPSCIQSAASTRHRCIQDPDPPQGGVL
jgi:hypothetical protein